MFYFITILTLNYRAVFNYYACKIGGFVIFFSSITAIFLVTAISFERYYMFRSPLEYSKLKFKTTFNIIISCVLSAFIIASLPIVGWSHYGYNPNLFTCNVEWNEPSLNVRSYIVFIVVTVYISPLYLIIFTSIKAFKSVIFFQANFKIFEFF